MTRTDKKINMANGIVLTGEAGKINAALTLKARWDRFSGLLKKAKKERK